MRRFSISPFFLITFIKASVCNECSVFRMKERARRAGALRKEEEEERKNVQVSEARCSRLCRLVGLDPLEPSVASALPLRPSWNRQRLNYGVCPRSFRACGARWPRETPVSCSSRAPSAPSRRSSPRPTGRRSGCSHFFADELKVMMTVRLWSKLRILFSIVWPNFVVTFDS